MNQYYLEKLGQLKFDRKTSIIKLRYYLNSFDYSYQLIEVRDIFNFLIENNFNDLFDDKFKYCLDKIFDNNEYKVFKEEPYESGRIWHNCFPDETEQKIYTDINDY